MRGADGAQPFEEQTWLIYSKTEKQTKKKLNVQGGEHQTG
jgi:hypothetical protein